MSQRSFVSSLFYSLIFSFCTVAQAETLGVFDPNCDYFNDFQSSVGDEWSTTGPSPLGLDSAPLNSSRMFLGRNDGFNTNIAGGVGAETVSLNLISIGAHSNVTVEFDLFILQSWDAAGPFGGPDVFNFNVGGGPVLLNTTFSNVQELQHYPANFSGDEATDPPLNTHGTGSAEQSTLGYNDNYGDSDTVYHLSFTFPHTASNLTLNFAGVGLTSIDDEAWGLDNVSVRWGNCGNDAAKQAATDDLKTKLTTLQKAVKGFKLESSNAKVKALKKAFKDVKTILTNPALDVFMAAGVTLINVTDAFKKFKKAYNRTKKRDEKNFGKDKKSAKQLIADLIVLIGQPI